MLECGIDQTLFMAIFRAVAAADNPDAVPPRVGARCVRLRRKRSRHPRCAPQKQCSRRVAIACRSSYPPLVHHPSLRHRG